LGTRQDREHSIDLQALGLPTHILAALDFPFVEKEVWETITQFLSDKALGPDGFMGGLYKACWMIIKQDIMAAMSVVWSRKLSTLKY
jgi:hypothetical protein